MQSTHSSAFHKVNDSLDCMVYPTTSMFNNNSSNVNNNAIYPPLSTDAQTNDNMQNPVLPINSRVYMHILTPELLPTITINGEKKDLHDSETKKINDVREEIIIEKDIDGATNLDKSIKIYQSLEDKRVNCTKCNNSSSVVDCFGDGCDGFLCIDCAIVKYDSVSQLVDWENSEPSLGMVTTRGKTKTKKDKGKRLFPCDRLKHLKEMYSYIRYSYKRNQYEVGKLCIYCRNVKRFEYLQKSKSRRMKLLKKEVLRKNSNSDEYP